MVRKNYRLDSPLSGVFRGEELMEKCKGWLEFYSAMQCRNAKGLWVRGVIISSTV